MFRSVSRSSTKTHFLGVWLNWSALVAVLVIIPAYNVSLIDVSMYLEEVGQPFNGK